MLCFNSSHLRNNLEARSRKCIFLGYSTTSKAYRLYDEENKRFILSRDVIFLEFEKDAHNIEKQLSHLDRFQSKKFYHGWDNELPTLERRIPFLGQSLEVSKNEEPTEREDNSSKKKTQNLK